MSVKIVGPAENTKVMLSDLEVGQAVLFDGFLLIRDFVTGDLYQIADGGRVCRYAEGNDLEYMDDLCELIDVEIHIIRRSKG